MCADCILNVYDVTAKGRRGQTLYIYTHVLGENKSSALCTNLALTSAKATIARQQLKLWKKLCLSSTTEPGSCILHQHDAQPAFTHSQRPTADSGSLSNETVRTRLLLLESTLTRTIKKKKKKVRNIINEEMQI